MRTIVCFPKIHSEGAMFVYKGTVCNLHRSATAGVNSRPAACGKFIRNRQK